MATFYISSTFEDLKEYRNAAIEALLRAKHQAVTMENTPASDDRPLTDTLGELERCDACIFIVGFRYGYVPADSDGISVTEAEYHRARELHKPILAFLLDEHASWPVQFIDSGESARSIQAFRAAIARDLYPTTFKSLEDFTDRLMRSVDEWAIRFTSSNPAQSAAPAPAVSAPAMSTTDQWPQDLDLRVLAWHLVADFKSGPDLLRHMDIELLRQAIEKWELENNANTSASWSERVTTANAQLLSKHQGWAPNKLWLGWMEPPRIPVATGSPTRKADTDAVKASMSRANQA